jgi:hypothetical protein
MWHYVAKNFFKPHIVFSDSNITTWHTPACIRIQNKDNFMIHRDLKKIEYIIEAATEKAEAYKYVFNRFVNGW